MPLRRNVHREASVGYFRAFEALTGYKSMHMNDNDWTQVWVAHFMLMNRGILVNLRDFFLAAPSERIQWSAESSAADAPRPNREAWIEAVMKVAQDHQYGFSEYYTYGMWLRKFYPDRYEIASECNQVKRFFRAPPHYIKGACLPPARLEDEGKSCYAVLAWEVQKFDPACDVDERSTLPN
ncbi:hypothetical protein CYMTET_22867 [Cymbomonas tetramitiformis]|uniref:Uncharacterized protein n=1 Tax=Cymbomonas tetramitiformis TaxID=36881 RepID=A0AAE0L1N9_9CHLO|nr:hypothetical protein CYMTET_22867 [Cymbomonas tetramitiformis]